MMQQKKKKRSAKWKIINDAKMSAKCNIIYDASLKDVYQMEDPSATSDRQLKLENKFG